MRCQIALEVASIVLFALLFGLVYAIELYGAGLVLRIWNSR